MMNYRGKIIHGGIKIYFNTDVKSNPILIYDLITVINNESHLKLKYFNFLKSATAKQTRNKIYDQDIFLRDFLKEEYSSVSFFDKLISQFSEAKYSLYLTIFFEKQMYKPPHIEFYFKGIDILKDIDKVINNTFLKDFIYGYIFVSDEWKTTAMQTSLIPVSEWDPKNPNSVIPEEKELFFYQRNQDKIQSYIFKAYWGNFLNKNHVRKLGGFEKIKKEAPVFLAKELSNGVYLQLTESLNDIIRDNFHEKWKRLEEYFKPLKMQGSPTPLY